MNAVGHRTLLLYWLLLGLVAVPAWLVAGLVGYSIATAGPGEFGDRLMAVAIGIPAVGIGLTATIAWMLSWSARRASVLACLAWLVAATCAGALLIRGLPETNVIALSLVWIVGAALVAASLVLDLLHH